MTAPRNSPRPDLPSAGGLPSAERNPRMTRLTLILALALAAPAYAGGPVIAEEPETTLDDYAAAVSRAIRAALGEDARHG